MRDIISSDCIGMFRIPDHLLKCLSPLIELVVVCSAETQRFPIFGLVGWFSCQNMFLSVGANSGIKSYWRACAVPKERILALHPVS